MGSVGKLAFGVILGLGALTGVLSFFLFNEAIPEPGITDSVYRKDLPIIPPDETVPSTEGGPQSTTEQSSGATTTPSSDNGSSAQVQPANGTAATSATPTGASITLIMLAGSATQGNPDYDPDPTPVKKGDSVNVVNEDTMPHTVTSGEAPGPDAGQLFDTGIVEAGGSAIIETTSLEPGDYPYHCMVHPYMKGVLTVS